MREMKDSGVEWIGLIPKSWMIKKIKNAVLYIGSGTTPPSHIMDYYDGDIFWIQSGDIYGKSAITDTETQVTLKAVHALSALRVYEADYIVIAMYGGSVGNIAISKIDACVNQACCCIKPSVDNSLRYMYYWIFACKDDFLLQAFGGGQPNISQTKIKNQYYLQPSLMEQRKIADFLDVMCAEIDILVSDVQAQIELMEQYKCAVITETVTKGLNSGVEMLDSGYEWVGRIPVTWEMKKGKYLFAQRSTKGNMMSLELLSPTQKYGVIPQSLYEELSGMTAVKLNEKADLTLMKTIHKGDYCISLRSFQGGFEYSEYEGVVSPAYQVFYPTVEISDGYYKYLFKEKGFIEKMNSYTMTLRDGKNIAFADFGNTYIPYPPVEEQQEIAEYLDIKVAEIDAVIADKKAQLEVLENYKKSLIYEYVTGKKEVPEQ